MLSLIRVFAIASAVLVSSLSLPAQDNQPTPAPVQKKKFTKDQIEQLVAPVALYPDGLLAQVLAASTCPVDVVEAARWVKHNPELQTDDIKVEMQNKRWDESVKGMVFFPQLLAKMNDNLDWTKDLGDAFLAQQKDVMDTIQEMRAKAKAAGTLKSDDKTKVTTDSSSNIQIESADPDTVYVQNYVPSTAYGTWNGGGNWYYPDVVTAPAWPWGWYGAPWSVGFFCAWGNGWIAYNNNFWNNHFINPWKYNANNLYDPRNPNIPDNLKNRQWRPDQARSRPVTQNVQQIARQLETEKRVPENFRGVDNAASRELRQAVDGRPSSKLSENRALENAERANAERELASREGMNHAFSGTMDGNLEREYSERGYSSRSLSSGYSGGYGGYHYHGGGGFHGGRR